jgi:hypothetical protein
VGKLRNGANNEGADFKKGYGPGDIIKAKFDGRAGNLSFAVNDSDFEVAFANENFKKGGYVAAVGSLTEGSKYSFTLPDL